MFLPVLFKPIPHLNRQIDAPVNGELEISSHFFTIILVIMVIFKSYIPRKPRKFLVKTEKWPKKEKEKRERGNKPWETVSTDP
jgi:hypothetical protein